MDYVLGDEVWYTGMSEEFPSGDTLKHEMRLLPACSTLATSVPLSVSHARKRSLTRE